MFKAFCYQKKPNQISELGLVEFASNLLEKIDGEIHIYGFAWRLDAGPIEKKFTNAQLFGTFTADHFLNTYDCTILIPDYKIY